MSRLIENLLTLARADGGVQLRREPVDLGELAEAVCRQAAALHPARQISFAGHARPGRRRRRGHAAPAAVDPARQRGQVHHRRWPRSGSRSPSAARWCSSPSPTTGSASRPGRRSGSSTGSTGPTRRAAAAVPGSGWRSPPGSSRAPWRHGGGGEQRPRRRDVLGGVAGRTAPDEPTLALGPRHRVARPPAPVRAARALIGDDLRRPEPLGPSAGLRAAITTVGMYLSRPGRRSVCIAVLDGPSWAASTATRRPRRPATARWPGRRRRSARAARRRAAAGRRSSRCRRAPRDQRDPGEALEVPSPPPGRRRRSQTTCRTPRRSRRSRWR